MLTNLVNELELASNEILAITASDHNICELTHPEYNLCYDNWEKWRRTYESGDEYIDYYLKKFSTREEDFDFETRKEITYVPAFAKSAVNDVKDAIFQRIADVNRGGGPKSYQDSVEGRSGGIDLAGTTMNSFIGTEILPELLTMSKVGVFVDMPKDLGETISEQQGKHPYIYHYPAEDILNWSVDVKNNKEYSRLLLRDKVYEYDSLTGLPCKVVPQYRYLWVNNNSVFIQLFNKEGEPIDQYGDSGVAPIKLGIPTIPFVLFELTDSLLKDVANYQIALLNLASSDIAYSLKSNYPFYVEAFDPRADNLFRRPSGQNVVHNGEDSVQIVQGGEVGDATIAKDHEIKVGATTGRRIPKGLDFPQFIHPSSEPLEASMRKQEELKKDIRVLVKLAVSNLSSKMASAESKGYDERGLEAGLSAIGLELEAGERTIAQIWRMYTGSQVTPTVKYPQKYSLQSDQDRRQEAKDIIEISKEIPSFTFKKESSKEAAHISIGTKVSNEKMDQIEREIENVGVIVDKEELHRDIELGLVDLQTASSSKGYPEDAVRKAKEDHAERVRRIAESQAKARGVPDLGGTENAGRSEKIDKDNSTVASKKTRGEA